MPTCSTGKKVILPAIHESSRHRPANDKDDLRQGWKPLMRAMEQITSILQANEQHARNIEQMRRRILGGANTFSGIKWQEPNTELDTTVFVPKNTWIYLSPANPLVTTGLKDLILGIVVKAVPGKWITMKDVPPQALVGGIMNYNVPQIPYPGAVNAVPSGSPLSGDLDGENVFWHLEQEYAACLQPV